MDQIEGHPIPQDVTNFQFKLVGEMTIKQIAYLAGGIILAWFIFSLPVWGIVKFSLGLTLGLFGAFLAFVNLEGRPADVMLGLFLKALIKPSRYKINAVKTAPYALETKTKLMDNESLPKQELPEIFLKTDLLKNDDQKKETENLESRQEEIPSLDLSQEEIQQKMLALEKKLNQTISEKEALRNRLIEVEAKVKKANPFFRTSIKKREVPNIKFFPDDLQKISGAPMVNYAPNLICGVVKNPKGIVLPNVLVEIKDNKKNSVRAIKTNFFGQFRTATPLLNGIYFINLDDPVGKNTFETVEVVVKGEVIAPLEIFAIDERDKIRKELFS